MARLLYIDCFSGAAGDMLLGALLDAGLPLDELRSALGSLALEGCEVSLSQVSRAGIAASRFTVRQPVPAGADPRHHHHHHAGHSHHDPHGHSHHTLESIAQRIDRSALSEPSKARAKALFRRLGEVEASIHQTTLDRVHLHEVGALDSVIDIVGVVFGLEWFAADRIVASPLNVGSGTVVCEHGTYPVPAPATAQLLMGAPVYSAGPSVELVTPTGALLVTEYASSYGPLPLMRIDRIGYGAGGHDFPDRPNVVRVLVGEEAGAPATERVVVLECEIDDMNPQIFGLLMDRLHAAGALDVFYAPVQMKKNRPGTLLTVVAAPEARPAISDLVFRETTTIGLRHQEMWRECLEREVVSVDTPVGQVRVKVARRAGAVLNVAPEFEDCVERAGEAGRSVKEVQALAMKAWLEREDRS